MHGLDVTSFETDDAENAVVEVEFRTDDPAYPLVELSELTDCKIILEQLMPGKDNGYFAYYQIKDVSPFRIQEFFDGYDGLDANLVTPGEETGIFEVRIDDENRYFAPLLTEAGALLSQLWTIDGEARLLVEVPAVISSTEVITLVLEKHPTVEVVAQRQKAYRAPLFTQEQFREVVYEELTERQREVLFAAYSGGYFESPRQKSGEELAAELGIASPTFSEHLRAAQQKILSLLF